MIEKLERHTRVEKGLTRDIEISCPPEQSEIVSKINELVDAVNKLQERVNDHDQAFDDCARDITKTETMLKNINTTVGSLITDNNIHEKQIDELQMKLEPHKCEPAENGKCSKMEQDPFAEQRGWVGCVCRFWYDNPADTALDYLGRIQTGKNGIEYYGMETYDWFPHCEPILPTDPAIYKGDDK